VACVLLCLFSFSAFLFVCFFRGFYASGSDVVPGLLCFQAFLFLLLLVGLNWAYPLLHGLLASMSYMKSVWESYAENMVEATGSSL
jgi:hypothetical protein